ncbi:hypothetical protein [Streptomyces sp. M2CJ-2]|nr:hypothetical protein [Streptomyces sp. M2CJ-2]
MKVPLGEVSRVVQMTGDWPSEAGRGGANSAVLRTDGLTGAG